MKTSSILIIGLTALSLSACGATTGGVVKSMAKEAAVSTAKSKVMPEQSAATTVVTQAPTVNANMDCAALTTELAEVDARIATANDTISGGSTADIAGKTAATGASQAALRSGAAGKIARVPFGGFFAKTAMDSVANSGQKKIDKAKVDLQEANLEKASLTGLYAGKNCSS